MTEIQINNEQELRAVLTVIEKTMPEVSWYAGQKPLEYIPDIFPIYIAFDYVVKNKISRSGSHHQDYTTLSPSTFISQQLPSWCVKNDGSERFKETVLKWLNEKGGGYAGNINNFYGMDSGTRSSFNNFGVELTLSEFETIFGVEPKWEPKQGEMISVKATGGLWCDTNNEFVTINHGKYITWDQKANTHYSWDEARPLPIPITLTRGDQVLTPPFDEATKQELKRLIGE